jgi:surface protein
MSEMFCECKAFNQPLDRWNVSNVTYMYAMFYGCRAFNQPLDSWNVSNVTHMDAMFDGCHVFNQPLDSWNVRNVTDMSGMFDGCRSFDQSLNSWTVSNTCDTRDMFKSCHALTPTHISEDLVKAYYSKWHHHPTSFPTRSLVTIQQDLDKLQQELDKLKQEKASLIIRRTMEASLHAMRKWSGRPPLVLGSFDPGSHDYRLSEERWTRRQRLGEK